MPTNKVATKKAKGPKFQVGDRVIHRIEGATAPWHTNQPNLVFVDGGYLGTVVYAPKTSQGSYLVRFDGGYILNGEDCPQAMSELTLSRFVRLYIMNDFEVCEHVHAEPVQQGHRLAKKEGKDVLVCDACLQDMNAGALEFAAVRVARDFFSLITASVEELLNGQKQPANEFARKLVEEEKQLARAAAEQAARGDFEKLVEAEKQFARAHARAARGDFDACFPERPIMNPFPRRRKAAD